MKRFVLNVLVMAFFAMSSTIVSGQASTRLLVTMSATRTAARTMVLLRWSFFVVDQRLRFLLNRRKWSLFVSVSQ